MVPHAHWFCWMFSLKFSMFRKSLVQNEKCHRRGAPCALPGPVEYSAKSSACLENLRFKISSLWCGPPCALVLLSIQLTVQHAWKIVAKVVLKIRQINIVIIGNFNIFSIHTAIWAWVPWSSFGMKLQSAPRWAPFCNRWFVWDRVNNKIVGAFFSKQQLFYFLKLVDTPRTGPVCIEDKEMHRLVPDAVLWWSAHNNNTNI